MKLLLENWREYLNENKQTLSFDEVIRLLRDNPDQERSLDMQKNQGTKSFGGVFNPPIKVPFDYGEYPNLINSADGMGWDFIIADESNVSDTNLQPVGYFSYYEDEDFGFYDSDQDEDYELDGIGEVGDTIIEDKESFLEQKEKEEDIEKEVERLEEKFPNKGEEPEVYGDEERKDVYPNENEESSSEQRDYPEENKFKNDVEKVMKNMNIGKIVVKEPGTPEGQDVVEVVKEEEKDDRGLSWQRGRKNLDD